MADGSGSVSKGEKSAERESSFASAGVLVQTLVQTAEGLDVSPRLLSALRCFPVSFPSWTSWVRIPSPALIASPRAESSSAYLPRLAARPNGFQKAGSHR